jgi:hypothetical protein
MTSILSAISGQFGKNLILGAFLPVVIFVTINLIFVVPVFPSDWPLFQPISSLETQGRLLTISFISVVLTGLLLTLNIPILRLYEGYPWMHSWIGQLMIDLWRRRLLSVQSQRLGLRTLIREMKNKNKDPSLVAKVTARRDRAARHLNNDFPSKPSLIIPTRLGNVVRSFEEYPDRQYGMGAVTLMPRLVGKIDKDYAIGMDDAKTSFDFMLNNSILSYVTAIVLTIAGLIYFPPHSLFYARGTANPRALIFVWLLTILVFILLGYLGYLGAIERASAWGGKVKGAFDLYRADLLKQLGYERKSLTLKQERQLWDAISLQLIYGDPPWGRDPNFEYTTPATFARSDAPFVELQLVRGISLPDTYGRVTAAIRLQNIDAKNRDAKNVVITENLIDGFDYEWNSAKTTDGRPIRTSGTNPYKFAIGGVGHLEEVTLRYRMIKRGK